MLLRYSTQRQGIPLRSSTDTFICCKLPNINIFLSILTYICDFRVMSCIPVVHDVQIIMRKLLFTLYSLPQHTRLTCWYVSSNRRRIVRWHLWAALALPQFRLLPSHLYYYALSFISFYTILSSYFLFRYVKLHLHVRFSWFVFYHASLIII